MSDSESPLPIPPSRFASAVGRAIDVAHKLTRPVLLDAPSLLRRGPSSAVWPGATTSAPS